MGTIKRLNEQKDQQAQAEAAMPGAYDNKYDAGIQDALAGMDTANNAGLGFDSANGTYRGALSRLFGNAGAGASAAEQVANSLSGGYGADWAKSAAQQAAGSLTDQTANVYAKARADALSQWQQELADKNTKVATMLGQDQLARGEYDGSVADASAWRDYRYGRTEQARQENSDFMSNLWNVIQNGISDMGKAYDAYMGYSQQKANAIVQAKEEYRNGNVDGAKAILRMYRMDENMFDNLQGVSDLTVQQNAALVEGFNMLQQGAPEEMITQYLQPYGLSYDVLKNWSGLSQTDKDNLDYLIKAGDITASGNDTLGQTIARAVGYGADSMDSYSTIANRLNQSEYNRQNLLNKSNLNYLDGQLKLQNKYKPKSTGSTGRSSGKSGTSGQKFSNSELKSMFTDYAEMPATDPRHDFYKKTLTDAGWLTEDSTKSTGGTATRASTQSSPLRSGLATARGMRKNGYSLDDIAGRLSADGITDNTLISIMKIVSAEK